MVRSVNYRRLIEILVRNKCNFFFTFQILYQQSVIIQRTRVQAESPVPSPGTGGGHVSQRSLMWAGLDQGGDRNRCKAIAVAMVTLIGAAGEDLEGRGKSGRSLF